MYYIGVDLGQRRDFSAIAVVERAIGEERFDPVRWRTVTGPRERKMVVRHLERIRLGTPYTDVVARVGEVVRSRALSGPRRVVVDATGVGAPVVDMLRMARLGCEIIPVLLTGGDAQHHDSRIWHVPKLDLMAGLQAALERRELEIARGMREAGTLVRELLDVRVTALKHGRRVGADGAGLHDDLVVAVALACWAGFRTTAGEKGEGRIV